MGWKYTEAQVAEYLSGLSKTKVGQSLTVADFKPQPKPNKYGAKKVTIDGYKFDSKAEARRYQELKLIDPRSLLVHPIFPITINGKHVCSVILDFQYWPKGEDCEPVYEDIKGKDTALSRLKRKMVEAAYGIKVEVITARK